MAFSPDEANSPLIVDADRMLSLSLACQRFQPITGRHAKVIETLCIVE